MGKTEKIITDKVWDIYQKAPLRLAQHYYDYIKKNGISRNDAEYKNIISSLKWCYQQKQFLELLELTRIHFRITYMVGCLDALGNAKNNKVKAKIHYLLANSYFYDGEGGTFFSKLGLNICEEAIRECKEAIKLEPYNVEYRNHLLTLYIQGTRQYDDALREAEEIHRIDPNHPHIKEELAELRRRVDSTGILSKEAKIHFNWGLVCHREGKLDEAIIEYQKTLKLAPNYISDYWRERIPWPYLIAFQDEIRSNKRELTINIKSNIHFCLGLAYYKKGEKDKAIEEMNKVIGISGGSIVDNRSLIRRMLEELDEYWNIKKEQ